jgi:hypothetical protein
MFLCEAWITSVLYDAIGCEQVGTQGPTLLTTNTSTNEGTPNSHVDITKQSSWLSGPTFSQYVREIMLNQKRGKSISHQKLSYDILHYIPIYVPHLINQSF